MIGILIAIVSLSLNAEARKLKGNIFTDEAVHRKFRRYLIMIVSLCIFNNLMILIPILYMNGYISRWAAHLSANHVKDKFALALSFSIAAIISGVVGNFAYDALKHFVLRSFAKNAAKEP